RRGRRAGEQGRAAPLPRDRGPGADRSRREGSRAGAGEGPGGPDPRRAGQAGAPEDSRRQGQGITTAQARRRFSVPLSCTGLTGGPACTRNCARTRSATGPRRLSQTAPHSARSSKGEVFMSRFIGLASLLLVAGVAFGAGGLKPGTPAPEIEGKDADGKALKLSDHKGKVVMLSFWASWCPPCRALFDHEKELVKKFADKP